MPKSEIPSVAITVTPENISVTRLAKLLRTGTPSVVGTVEGGKLRLDVRTVFPHQDGDIVKALKSVLSP